MVGTPDLFFRYRELFSPTLLNHEGDYFIASRFSVGSYDHIHMATLFQQQVVPDEVAIGAASALAAIWSTQFAALDLIGEAAGTDLLDAEVTL